MNYLKRMLRGHGIITLIIVFFISGMTWASDPTMFYKLQLKPEKPDDTWALRTFNDAGTQVFEIDEDGRIIEAADETTMGMVSLPLTSFTNEGITMVASGPGAFINNESNSAAKFGLIDGNPVIRLGTDTWVESSFRVPDDYYQNGDFRVKTVSAENGHAAKLDFAVRVNTDSAIDTVDSVETAVALPVSASSATIAELDLTPTTDFSALAEGNWVTIRVKRTAKVGAYDNDVDIYNFVFRYERQY